MYLKLVIARAVAERFLLLGKVRKKKWDTIKGLYIQGKDKNISLEFQRGRWLTRTMNSIIRKKPNQDRPYRKILREGATAMRKDFRETLWG